MSFDDGRLEGGFSLAESAAAATGELVIFFSEDLERDLDRVQQLGATISKPIFSFPGGKRFHFVDPTGTEYAIWSAVDEPSNGE